MEVVGAQMRPASLMLAHLAGLVAGLARAQRLSPARLAQDAVKTTRLVSAKKLFSLVLLSDLLPGHGQFLQNTALILRLSLLG
jgi:hypothetical protein